jgi:hypothetical protein
VATLPKEFDARNLVNGHFTLEVKIKRLGQWRWRLWLALLLCKWAAKLAWLDFKILTQSEGKPYLYYCPYCHREVYGREPEEAEYKTIGCPHCHCQFLIIGDFSGPELVTEDTFDLCEYECHWQDPYGFVPEAGCPIHDRA